MKIAAIIVRVLMGLMFAFSSVVVLFNLVPQPELSGDIKTFMDLVCAIAFISGMFVPLANVVVFPINVNILLYHIFLAPEGLIVAILLMLANLFLAYYYRDKYMHILRAK